VEEPKKTHWPERCCAAEALAFGERPEKLKTSGVRDMHAVTGVACLKTATSGVLSFGAGRGTRLKAKGERRPGHLKGVRSL